MTAAMTSSPYSLVGHARVGSTQHDGIEASPLLDMLVAGETPLLATSGEEGAALFTSARLLVAERVGILSKRRAVKVLRRRDITAYAIDADTDDATLTLLGAGFGMAVMVFDRGFDPMLLSAWLGETLTGSTS